MITIHCLLLFLWIWNWECLGWVVLTQVSRGCRGVVSKASLRHSWSLNWEALNSWDFWNMISVCR